MKAVIDVQIPPLTDRQLECLRASLALMKRKEPRQPITLCFCSLVIGVFLGAGLNILAMLAGLYWA